MGLSRRMFTQEFKLAAVRRLEQGVRFRATLFLARASGAGRKVESPSWSARLASRRWRSIS